MTQEDYRPGTVRFKGSDGAWITVSPYQPLYSTAIMVALEFWHSESKTWKAIDEYEEDD